MFEIALFSIPFDNLFFAPSRGWGAISPILFLFYCLVNIKSFLYAISKSQKLILFTLLMFFYGTFIATFSQIHLDSFFNTIITFSLGISFYFAFVIRYIIHKKDVNKDGQVLFNAYLVSFLYGLLRLYALNYSPVLVEYLNLLELRSYSRLAFTFTEPSFIAIHLYGVLLPFTCFLSDSRLIRKIIVLYICFVAVTIFSASSARTIIDTSFFLLLVLLSYLRDLRNKSFILIFLPFINLFINAALSNGRILRILERGVYGDFSLAARFFNINAVYHGFLNDPISFFFGYGIGNLILPIRSGFNQAVSEYQSSYVREIILLANREETSSIYFMPFKFIVEFGFVFFVWVLSYFIYKIIKGDADLFLFLMILFIYFQFDSYAFYSIWLFLFLIRFGKAKSFSKSYFPYIPVFYSLKKLSSIVVKSP